MMHFFKSKKFIIMIVSAIMMTSLGITANAESLLDQTLTYDSNKSAFLNYDPAIRFMLINKKIILHHFDFRILYIFLQVCH